MKDFVRWVEMRAPDPREVDASKVAAARTEIDFEKDRTFLAFQRPAPPEIPEVREKEWPRHEIDPFILAKWEADGISHAGDA